METTLILSGMFIVSTLSIYGYYLILKKNLREFELKRKTRIEYRTNEEFASI
ncbi:MAG: hypothetical protein R6V27_12785 [Balneolaceae bacterium]